MKSQLSVHPPAARRVHVLRVRVSAEEYERIKKTAHGLGLAVSEYMRDAAVQRASNRRLTEAQARRLIRITEVTNRLENLLESVSDDGCRAGLADLLRTLQSVWEVV